MNASFLTLIAVITMVHPARAETSESRLRGHVTLGHEARSFEPCGDDEALWIVPNAELRAAYEALSHEPYAPVFVELRGELGPAPESGFGAEYDEQLEVFEVMRAAPATEGHGCTEDLSGIAFRASGNEPFWNFLVSREAISLTQLGGAELLFPVAPPERRGQGWVYTANADARSISVTLEQGSCSDTMVGARYTWRAHVALDGELYDGCAWEGDDSPRAPRSRNDMLELTSVEWQLVAIDATEGATIEPDPANAPTIRFTNAETDAETRRFSGHGGCNRYFGSYIAGDDGSLSIPSPIGATRMACPPPIVDVEMALFQTLEAARSYEIRERELDIHCETGTLRFMLAPTM